MSPAAEGRRAEGRRAAGRAGTAAGAEPARGAAGGRGGAAGQQPIRKPHANERGVPRAEGAVARRAPGCHGDARRPCPRAAPGETPREAGTRVTAEPRAGRAQVAAAAAEAPAAGGEAAAGHASARTRC